MSTLTEPEIKDIIIKNPNKDLVLIGKKLNKQMRMHCYGENLEASLTTIDGYEKESLRKLRVKYAKSNRDLMARMGRPIDKVFSARGGSIYYNLPEAQEKQARQLSMDVRGGISIRKWNETQLRAHYIDDPYGLVFMEIADVKRALQLRSKGKSFVYPTYKSIQGIYDYLPNGSMLEYVVFIVNNSEKAKIGLKPEDQVYRVVDDSMDYYVKRTGDDVSILWEHSMNNLFMYVPGMLNSDIPDPNVEGGTLSIFSDVLELAMHYLMKGSIKVTHEFLFAFPKYWEYADKCDECKGMGVINGKDICPKCNGSKLSGAMKVSDAKMLSWPTDKEDPIVAPNVAGFVSPDEIYYNIATKDLQLIEDIMKFTVWGASDAQKTAGMGTDAAGATKTATEITNEIKPQADRLAPITECFEKRYKFQLDSIVRIQISQNYQGASVNYGKRYMIEGPDAIWDKYSKARSTGAAYSVLDDLLEEYYEAKYNSDPVKLDIQTKLMRVEPFVHLTISEVKGLGTSDDDYKMKLYYGEWLSTVNKATLVVLNDIKLREELTKYVGTKELAEPPKQKLLPAA